MYNILFFFQLIDRSERNDENGEGGGGRKKWDDMDSSRRCKTCALE